MIETILQIDGMSCPMCESHINDVIRREFKVKKATSSHKKGTAVIISDSELDEDKLTAAIGATGYKVLSFESHQYIKKGLFSSLK